MTGNRPGHKVRALRPIVFGVLALVCVAAPRLRAHPPGIVLHATVADATTGVLLQGVEVKVRKLGLSALSDIFGDVRFSAIPSGEYAFEATLMGYERLSTSLKIGGRDSVTVVLLLRRASQLLPPVTVVDTAPDLLSEFEQRRRRHIGGYFITEAEIRGQHGSTLGNIILAEIPGIGVLRIPGGGELLYSRRGPNNPRQGLCGILIFYNGVRGAGPSSLEEVGAVEFYNPGFVPVRYRELGSGCGVMLIWSPRNY